jgi:hypothetical protein
MSNLLEFLKSAGAFLFGWLARAFLEAKSSARVAREDRAALSRALEENEERGARHEEKIREIDRGVDAPRASVLLSTWPSEGPTPPKARP